METKIRKIYAYYLVIWMVIVFFFLIFIQRSVTNDNRWNHAQSYSSLCEKHDISWHEWVAYAFWVPIDTPGENPRQNVSEDDFRTFTDWMTTLIFLGLSIVWFLLAGLSVIIENSRYRIFLMSTVCILNIWLLIDTISMYHIL